MKFENIYQENSSLKNLFNLIRLARVHPNGFEKLWYLTCNKYIIPFLIFARISYYDCDGYLDWTVVDIDWQVMDVHPDGPGADKDPVVDRDPAVLVKDEDLDVPDKDEDIDGPG